MAAEPHWKALPFNEATRFFRGKDGVFIPSATFRDVQGELHSHAFMVSGAAHLDLLSDLYGAVQKGIDKGTTLQEFQKNFDEIVAKRGWDYRGDRAWRTKVIFETNLNTSYAAGRFAQMRDPDVMRDRPYWEYRIGFAVHHRPHHVELNGVVLRADDAFWATGYPPNGWGCHCWVKAVTSDEAGALGINEKAPDYTPDEGWDHSVGHAWEKGFEAVMRDKLGTVPDQMRKDFLAWLPKEKKAALLAPSVQVKPEKVKKLTKAEQKAADKESERVLVERIASMPKVPLPVANANYEGIDLSKASELLSGIDKVKGKNAWAGMVERARLEIARVGGPLAKLDPIELAVARDYAASGFKNGNVYLWRGEVPKGGKLSDKYFEAWKTTLNQALQKLPKYEGGVSHRIEKFMDGWSQKLEPGSEVLFKGFLSSGQKGVSLVGNYAYADATTYVIKSAGQGALLGDGVAKFASEAEVLFPAGTRLEIESVSINKTGGRTVVARVK